MANDPTTHETPIAVAMYSQACGINIRACSHRVHCGHEIMVVFSSPVSKHRHGEGLAVSSRTSGVDGEHKETSGGEYLLGEVEGIVESRVGTAMDVEY
jgi:hypothetical protein